MVSTMNPSRLFHVRSVPQIRRNPTTSGSVGVNSSTASATPELPPMSLDEIMMSPSGLLKPRLHPDRRNRPKDVWFGLDNCVRIDISSIYQNDFSGVWSCLQNVPLEHQVQWWSKFAQWKTSYVKPDFVGGDNWNLLVERWDTPAAVKKAKISNKARKSLRDGYKEHLHTACSKSFAKIQFEMAEKNNSVMPSILDLIKRTHTQSDETFVDKKAEKILENVRSSSI